MSKNLFKTIAASILLLFGITALSTAAFAQTSSDQVTDEEYDDDLLEEVIVTTRL